jgi:hypothetical protein
MVRAKCKCKDGDAAEIFFVKHRPLCWGGWVHKDPEVMFRNSATTFSIVNNRLNHVVLPPCSESALYALLRPNDVCADVFCE